jgi:hypothetical protein
MIVINEQDLLGKIYQILKLYSTLGLKKMGDCERVLVGKKIEEIIRGTPGLEPCPFCSNAPDVDLEEGLGFKIRCVNKQCEINCESNRGEDLQELISQWNKRGGDK